MVACAVIACIGNITANRMAAKTTMLFSTGMRRDLFSRTLHLSARSTDRFTIPSLESRITTDTYHVQNFVGVMQRMGIRAPILLLGGSIISLTYWLDKETGLPVKIVTDSGDSPRWMNIAYTYANRYASMMFDMPLEDAIAMYPAEAEYLNVQTFEVLDFGEHIEIQDPTAEQ